MYLRTTGSLPGGTLLVRAEQEHMNEEVVWSIRSAVYEEVIKSKRHSKTRLKEDQEFKGMEKKTWVGAGSSE